MFKTEDEENEQLDFWMDLINETQENYEPRPPRPFLKRGQGQTLRVNKSPSKQSPLMSKAPTKRDKNAPLTYEDKLNLFVDRMEGGTGGPFGNP